MIMHPKALVRQVLSSSPWTLFRTYRRDGTSRLNVDGIVSVTDISQQASAPATLDAAGGLGAVAGLIQFIGDQHNRA
jgi:hypothetical protein